MQIIGIRCENCDWQKHNFKMKPGDTENDQIGEITCLRCGRITEMAEISVERMRKQNGSFSKNYFVVRTADGKESKICLRIDIEAAFGSMLEQMAKRAMGQSPDMQYGG